MEQILLGIVTKPQGLKGEFRVRLSADISLLQGLKNVMINEKSYEVLRTNDRGGFVVMQLKNVTDIAQVEPWRNALVYAFKTDIHLKQNEHLASQLLGLSVVTQTGHVLGTVTAVDNYGAGDIYTVRQKNGKEFLFAGVNDVVMRVSCKKNEMIVNEEILKQGMVEEDGH